MSPRELIQTLETRGIHLWADGDRLRWKAPVGSLTPELKETLSAQKAELLRVLGRPCDGCQVRGNRPTQDDPSAWCEHYRAAWRDLSSAYAQEGITRQDAERRAFETLQPDACGVPDA